MTKILFTTSQLEHPPKGGPTLRIENSIKALSSVAEVVLVSRLPLQQIGGEQALQYYHKYCSKFLFVTEHNAFVAASRLLEIARSERVQVLWLGYGNISYEILHHLGLQKCSYPVVIDTDSVWSRFILRGLSYHDRLEDKIRIFSEGWLKRWEEYWGTQSADITTAVSSVDAEYYKIFTYRMDSVQIFSNVIDPENYRGVYENLEIKRPCIYLAGTFWPGSPMEEAAKWILEKVLPIVRLSVPNIHFYIVGKSATDVLKFKSNEHVTITGTVQSVLPYLSNVDVAVVPLKFESGTRFKIMEAGICNIPIVSTTLGAEGIPVKDRHDILLADTPEGFASCIIELINKPELSRKLVTNCRSLIERQYSITTAAKEADAILRFFKHPLFRKVPYLDPGICEISERLYKATPNSDLATTLGFSIILFNHLIRKYGNHPLFLPDEEREEATILLKQMKRMMPNNSNVNEALSSIEATDMQLRNYVKAINRKSEEACLSD